MVTEIGELGPDEFAILDEPLGLVRVWLRVEFLRVACTESASGKVRERRDSRGVRLTGSMWIAQWLARTTVPLGIK